tara:strand:+ start:316 stop:1290 length:975 start_codon:yes stop_codon:yes gene_type:complete
VPINNTIIIGSGIAGLSCGIGLAARNIDATILDKGRNIGGRMATRVTSAGFEFDHGVQYIKAKDEHFQRVIQEARRELVLSQWEDGSVDQRFVGTPRMNSFPAKLGEGLNIRQAVNVERINRDKEFWSIYTDVDVLRARNVVVTIPAPQIPSLIGLDHPLSERLSLVEMSPCITLMAAFRGVYRCDLHNISKTAGNLAWIANNSSKPGRTGADCWVAQAAAPWSDDRIDAPTEEIEKSLLSMLGEEIGVRPEEAIYSEVHRWRYANVTMPLGESCLKDSTNSLFLGGDWCLGAKVEAAWKSGEALAHEIIKKQGPAQCLARDGV